MIDQNKVVEWIEKYNLQPHPEGGYFFQKEKSAHILSVNGKNCSLYTSIYFLLTEDSPSHFHSLSHDELWFFHSGDPIFIHSIDKNGVYKVVQLGIDCFQTKVPAGHIFASCVENGQSLLSCVVIPGFEFEDFQLHSQEELLENYPQHKNIIQQLAYPKEELPQF